jgi:hypothetical protein
MKECYLSTEFFGKMNFNALSLSTRVLEFAVDGCSDEGTGGSMRRRVGADQSTLKSLLDSTEVVTEERRRR